MPRFFVAPEQINNDQVYISGPDVNHINRVLRLGPGDGLLVLDGRGGAYEAVIEKACREQVTCTIKKEVAAGTGIPVRVTLVQGIPKGDKMDLIIQKGTEIGISRVIPLICRRSVVKLKGDKSLRRLERWRRIALEAAKQCRRADVPEVLEPAGWNRVWEDMPPEAAAFILWEEEKVRTLKEIFRRDRDMVGEEVYVFIGPEGGFTPDEVRTAVAHGMLPVSLGPRILRTETAGLAVLSIILYQWGDLGGEAADG